jgi:lipoprotein-anchoring transpeptidase ErfK/SrfK
LEWVFIMTAGIRAALLLGALSLAGCMTAEGPVGVVPSDGEMSRAAQQAAEPPPPDPMLVAMYAARPDGSRTVPAIDVSQFHRALLRNEVDYATDQPPGTVVIDTRGPFLYLVEGEGRATRYGIAVGREGFGWSGTGVIARSAQWPRWTPPPEMIERDPSLEQWRAGMPGGVNNPLGARALYIYFDGRDSGYRIHGTNTPKSIGWAASSGCFRMLNQDVIDLYERVHRGARVVVL